MNFFCPPAFAMENANELKVARAEVKNAPAELKDAQADSKEAQAHLIAAQSDLKAAQAELENAQAELKEAELARLSSPEQVQMHDIIVQSAKDKVQSAKDKVQSAKEFRDVFVRVVDPEQGRMAQSVNRMAGSFELILKNQSLLMEAFMSRYRLTPVSDYTRPATDDVWCEKAWKHYNTRSCLVLQKVFPGDFQCKPWWLESTGWESIFPAVGEHIIPQKGYQYMETELEIEINNAHNSLLLLRHLEGTFQNGDWSLMPFEAEDRQLKFRIYVCEALKPQNVMYMNRDGDPEEQVFVKKGGRLQGLTFNDLHEKEIDISPTPFLRALFLKGMMAWARHQSEDEPLPHPQEFAEVFSKSCTRWNSFMINKLFVSIQQLEAAKGSEPHDTWTVSRGGRKLAFSRCKTIGQMGFDLSNLKTGAT